MSNPAPPVIQLGASIAVATTTELGTLDASHLNLGTQVMVTADNSVWLLTKSTAAIGAGVVAVSGITGWRWIEQGGTTGFVTLAQLADTTVTSGATLVGVNANGGMFSQPDLQHVLQSDVTLKTVLAASDGTGGASLVGVQDTGNYFGGSHALEPILQQLGAAKNPVQLTTGQKFEVDLTDAATNTASLARLTTHASSGTAAAGFGTIDKTQLKNASGAQIDASALQTVWKTATGGAEDSSISVQVMRGGVLTTVITFDGKNASGNMPVEIPTSNADNAAMLLSQNADQEIHKNTGGNLNLRNTRNATGAAVKIFGASVPAVQCIQAAGGFVDTVVGPAVILGAADTSGYLFIPQQNTAGAPSGPPSAYTGSVAMMFNTADHKLYVYDKVAAAWKSVLLS